jgi:L-lactate dehydrogenase complex protein LldG
MQEITSRENILKKIRQALIEKNNQRFSSVEWEKNVYKTEDKNLDEQFAHAFTKAGGKFIFCENELDFLENVISLSEENKWERFYCREKDITDIMDSVKFPYTKDAENFPEGMIGISSCESLVARLGSVLVSSKTGSGRRLFVMPTVHIVLAYSSQLVAELKDGLQQIKNKYGDQLP